MYGRFRQTILQYPMDTAPRLDAVKRCEATNVEDFDDHDDAPGIPLFTTKMRYKCGLSRDNTKGYKFCKACSEMDECPICGSPLRH